ncbi:MAG: diguanylate cyclase [Burkholderiales bacterium]|nr:diguanylate cyclase [Burkholderiales bacterium]
MPTRTTPAAFLRCLLRVAAFALLLLAAGRPAWAVEGEGDITLQGRYWIDPSGQATIAQVAGGTAKLESTPSRHDFHLGDSALWVHLDLPRLDPSHDWFLMLTGAAFVDHASLFVRGADGLWQEQKAGDHVPVAQWSHPNFTPLFQVPAGTAEPVWLRLQNQPAPTSAYVRLLTGESLQQDRQWTYLLIGGYLGFGLLVFVVGLIHARLYRDSVFVAYCVYVACMLLFQLAFTGLGGLFFWPHSAAINDAGPATSMLLMTASGIWFTRQACALERHGRLADRAVRVFSVLGALFPLVYIPYDGPQVFAVLNVYGLLAVLMSLSMCAWTWYRGERYSGWLLLGFLPVHLGYIFPALRAAGKLPDSWATQYAVLIGSAIEIPVLLYILHARARDFTENRVRLRALDSTDALTGLPILPVFQLRLRDALRRARRWDHRCSLLLVELANHADIVARDGREAGDRALVVAASRLSAVVREVDTVCRVANTRFAILFEGPHLDAMRRLLAQHIVARGLEPLPRMPQNTNLRFRVLTASVPDGAIELSSGGRVDDQRLMERLDHLLDRMLGDSQRVVHHLEPHSEAEPAPA